jgi:Ala-tRNA(Pro) deacylase
MAKIHDIVRYLKHNGIPFEIIPHEPAFTTREIASAVRVPDKELAKTLVVQVDGKFWMAVLRGDQRLNERLLKRTFGAHTVHLAHEEDLSSLFPDCEVGAMPPFGNLYGLPVIVEKELSEDEDIVFNACKHTESIRMKYRDYEQLVQPLIGHFSEHRRVYEDWERP